MPVDSYKDLQSEFVEPTPSIMQEGRPTAACDEAYKLAQPDQGQRLEAALSERDEILRKLRGQLDGLAAVAGDVHRRISAFNKVLEHYIEMEKDG